MEGIITMNGLFFLPALVTSIHLHSMLYTTADKGWVYPNHRHPLFEIRYCHKGQLIEHINGQPYSLPAGNAILVKSGVFHYPEAIEDSVYFNFHFDIDHQEIRLILQAISNPLLTPEDNPAESDLIRQWMERLIEQYRIFSGSTGKHSPQRNIEQSIHMLHTQSQMLEFISVICKIHMNKLDLQTSLQQSKVQIANEVALSLEKDETFHLQISDLAKKLNVHRSYISNCFKEVYGISPKYYALQVRIKKAKELLQRSNKPISGIASELSFSSTEYFCRFFRSHVGYTPHQYRTHART